MEARLGHDFSHVRVHADTSAADSARAVGAIGYTFGREVVFGAGRYAPQTPAGRKLIAHELTHAAQQAIHRDALHDDVTMDDAESDLEREAIAAADRVASMDGATSARHRISEDTGSVIRRWKITGSTATSNDESDTLSGLATRVGAHENDWKCIKALAMRTFDAGMATATQKKKYERFVQRGDQFDVSNLTTATGRELQLHLFSAKQAADVEIVKKFYARSVPSNGAPDSDIETAAKDGRTPLKGLMLFGHAAGSHMWGGLGNFDPSLFAPEEPVQDLDLARHSFFPRRCWFTRNAAVRLVGCDSETVGRNFADAYLRTGADVTTTTKSVASGCTTVPPGATSCPHPDALLFLASASRTAPIVDGPFTTAATFHGSRFWKTFKGKL